MKREFSLGSEWLYYKIYCGVKTADFILQDYLWHEITMLKEKKLIKKWFFIRYNDPESHFRLRFLVHDPQDLGKIIVSLQKIFEDLQTQNIVWKIQTDTYAREIERYGETTYESSETIFEADSEMILKYGYMKNDFTNEFVPLFFSCLAIDSFLELFALTNLQKLKLLDQMQASFKQEFDASKYLKKELDKQYRGLFEDLHLFMTDKKGTEFIDLYTAVEEKAEKIGQTIEKLTPVLDVSLTSFLSSHVHMMLNRQFSSRQREYELVVYDHLHRYYKAKCFNPNMS